MKASTLSMINVWLMDLITLGALAATGEVRIEIFACVGAAFLLSRIRAFKITNGVLVALLLLTILSAVGAWLYLKIVLITAVAHATPILHASLWLSAQRNREKTWRMAIGFVELNIAAILTAEFYLAPTIFLFALLATLAISSGFLEAWAKEYEKTAGPVLLPRNFLVNTVSLSFLILLTSFIIFPILPRIHTASEINVGEKHAGYTEEVNLKSQGSPKGSGEGRVALVYYLPKEGQDIELTTLFTLGLIRSRTLSHFDGNIWQPGPKEVEPSINHVHSKIQTIRIEAIREGLGTPAIPVPYGTKNVGSQDSESIEGGGIARLKSGEWINQQAQDRRIRYFVEVDRKGFSMYGSLQGDTPKEIHLNVPSPLNNQRLQALANRLFTPKMETPEKVAKLMQFFASEGFHAFAEESPPPSQLRLPTTLHPLEQFLFVSKEGHCELFSGATAILLRIAGVPTRLVAGFRISRGPLGGILSIRTGDAHAWLEYWLPEKGWKALDPTPRLIRESSALDVMRRIYELGSALWYKNVSNFDSNQQFDTGYQALKSLQSEFYSSDSQKRIEGWVTDNKTLLLWSLVHIVLLGICALLIVRTWFPWILSIRWKVNHGPSWLKRERLRMEEFLARKLYGRWIVHPHQGLDLELAAQELLARFGEPAAQAYQAWEQIYLQARFGGQNPVPRKKIIAELRTRRRAFSRLLAGSETPRSPNAAGI